MKIFSIKLGVLFTVVLCAVSIFSTPVSARDEVTPFHFSGFSADYHLSRDSDGFSTLRVEETLIAEFQRSGNFNRGIERAIPRFYRFGSGARREARNLNLTIDRVNEQFTTRSQRDFLIVRIGDPNRTVHGTREYEIAWSVRNATRNFDAGDEFYWNANGTGWSQTFNFVEARVFIPDYLASELDGRVKCWVGRRGESNENCIIVEKETPSGRVFVFRSSGRVLAGETLTFNIGFNPNTFTRPSLDVAAIFRVSTTAFWTIVMLAVTLTIVATAWLVIVIKKFRPKKTGRAIIPQYLPPKNLNIAESAVLFSARTSMRQFPAILVNFAINRYIEIIDDGKKRFSSQKFSFKLLRFPDKKLSVDEATILQLIFAENWKIGEIVKTADLQKNTKISIEVAKMIGEVGKRLKKDHGFYRINPKFNLISIIGLGVLNTVIFILCMVLYSTLPLLALLPSVVIMIITCVLFKPLSLSGTEAKEYLKGLRKYMKLAEADRLKVLQSVKGAERIATDQGKIIKLYERLLPYAIIFGITKDWTKAMQVYYDRNPSFVPVWFVGGSIGSFNASSFASSINSLSSSSSGLSGGGFSGGGGGGGGGGGW